MTSISAIDNLSLHNAQLLGMANSGTLHMEHYQHDYYQSRNAEKSPTHPPVPRLSIELALDHAQFFQVIHSPPAPADLAL